MTEGRKGLGRGALLAMAGGVGVAVLCVLWLGLALAFFGALTMGLVAAAAAFVALYFFLGDLDTIAGDTEERTGRAGRPAPAR